MQNMKSLYAQLYEKIIWCNETFTHCCLTLCTPCISCCRNSIDTNIPISSSIYEDIRQYERCMYVQGLCMCFAPKKNATEKLTLQTKVPKVIQFSPVGWNISPATIYPPKENWQGDNDDDNGHERRFLCLISFIKRICVLMGVPVKHEFSFL